MPVFDFRRNAETLPIWVCQQTLVLTTHLPLLSINMPGSSAIVLTEAAKVLRLEFIPLHDLWGEYLDIGDADKELDMLMG